MQWQVAICINFMGMSTQHRDLLCEHMSMQESRFKKALLKDLVQALVYF